MDESMALRILTQGVGLPSDLLFHDKEFEKAYVEHTHSVFRYYIANDSTLSESYEHLFNGEGKFCLTRRASYLRKVAEYISVTAGLIWLTGTGDKFDLLNDRISEVYVDSLFKNTDLPFPSEDISEAKQIMAMPLPERALMSASIRHGRYNRGKKKIQEGRSFSTQK